MHDKTSDTILETRQLTKSFKGFTAVNDVNLRVRQPRAVLRDDLLSDDRVERPMGDQCRLHDGRRQPDPEGGLTTAPTLTDRGKGFP